MDKKTIKVLTEKFNQFYRIDQDGNFSENLIFLLKALVIKFLDDNKQFDFIKNQALLRKRFTFDCLFEIWNQEPISNSFFSEKAAVVDDYKWDWLMAFVRDLPLLKGSNTDIIGNIYEKLLMADHKKRHGVFYTPRNIADFMVAQIAQKNRSYIKILDPACGSGVLLSASYDLLFKILSKNTNNDQKKDIHRQLLQSSLIGSDRDEIACLVTKLVLVLKGNAYVYPRGIKCCDVLHSEPVDKGSIDVIIANPPYVGHKEIDKDYRHSLKEKYAQVYSDKGDLSYCFIYRSWEFLKNKGQLIAITSRYFLEAHFGAGIRLFISDHFEIQELIDFNGNRVIKGIGVDPVILDLKKMPVVKQNQQVWVKRFKMPGNHDQKIMELIAELSLPAAKSYDAYFVAQAVLRKEPWRLYKPLTKAIIEKIEYKSSFFLDQLGETFQGMITGNDQAFIFEENELPFSLKDSSVLKPWLKNKEVLANHILPASKCLVYTDQIANIENEISLMNYLLAHKEKLFNRRECRFGKRPWYFLQWGRDLRHFTRKKIVFPYKASKNRFAVDEEGACFSADIYGMHISNQVSHGYTEESLSLLLNSELYNYYFKSYAKKLGHNLYEYYPNTVLKLKVPDFKDEEFYVIKDYYDIISVNSKDELVKKNEAAFNEWLYRYFELSDLEIDEIEK